MRPIDQTIRRGKLQDLIFRVLGVALLFLCLGALGEGRLALGLDEGRLCRLR
jgi:hypothetical protein